MRSSFLWLRQIRIFLSRLINGPVRAVNKNILDITFPACVSGSSSFITPWASHFFCNQDSAPDSYLSSRSAPQLIAKKALLIDKPTTVHIIIVSADLHQIASALKYS